MITEDQYADALERGYRRAHATLTAARGPDGKLPHATALNLAAQAHQTAERIYREQHNGVRRLGDALNATALKWVEDLAAHPWSPGKAENEAYEGLTMMPEPDHTAPSGYLIDFIPHRTEGWNRIAQRDPQLMDELRSGLDEVHHNQRIRDREKWSVGDRDPDRIKLTLTVEQADQLCAALDELAGIHDSRLDKIMHNFQKKMMYDGGIEDEFERQVAAFNRVDKLKDLIHRKLDAPPKPPAPAYDEVRERQRMSREHPPTAGAPTPAAPPAAPSPGPVRAFMSRLTGRDL